MSKRGWRCSSGSNNLRAQEQYTGGTKGDNQLGMPGWICRDTGPMGKQEIENFLGLGYIWAKGANRPMGRRELGLINMVLQSTMREAFFLSLCGEVFLGLTYALPGQDHWFLPAVQQCPSLCT